MEIIGQSVDVGSQLRKTLLGNPPFSTGKDLQRAGCVHYWDASSGWKLKMFIETTHQLSLSLVSGLVLVLPTRSLDPARFISLSSLSIKSRFMSEQIQPTRLNFRLPAA